jgi:hypothetical protein
VADGVAHVAGVSLTGRAECLRGECQWWGYTIVN